MILSHNRYYDVITQQEEDVNVDIDDSDSEQQTRKSGAAQQLRDSIAQAQEDVARGEVTRSPVKPPVNKVVMPPRTPPRILGKVRLHFDSWDIYVVGLAHVEFLKSYKVFIVHA